MVQIGYILDTLYSKSIAYNGPVPILNVVLATAPTLSIMIPYIQEAFIPDGYQEYKYIAMGFGSFLTTLVGYFTARDLAEMKKKLAEHDERLSNHDGRLSNHDALHSSHVERLSNHDALHSSHVERLSDHDADIDQLKFGQKDYDIEYQRYSDAIIRAD